MNIKLSDHFTYKKLLRFCLSPIIMMVFTSIYGVVDGLFVSNYVGKTAFAAINLVMPFIMIFGGIGFMFGTGGSALVAKTLGLKDSENANRYFTMMSLVTLVVGIIISIVGMIFMRPIAIFLGAENETIEHCVIYGRIIIGFNTAFMLQNLFQSFLITAEKPKLGLWVTVAAAQCVNEVLADIFSAQADVVGQLIERAHVGGAHADKLVLERVLVEQVVKQTVVVKVLRDGYLELTLGRAVLAEAEALKQQQEQRDYHEEQPRNGDVAHAAGKAERDGEEQPRDLLCAAGHAAEAHQRESTGDGKPRADVAVDEHDYKRDNGRQHRQRQRERAGVVAVRGKNERREHSECKR